MPTFDVLKQTPFREMPDRYLSDATFEKEDFAARPLEDGEYEKVTFLRCHFVGAALSKLRFVDCIFEACDLSLAKLDGSVLHRAIFRQCKMLGLRFDTCSPFGLSFSFEDCRLDHASFYKTRIPGTVFRRTELTGVDFSECDLSRSVLDECELREAVFDRTLLEKADFRTALGYSIDPERNRIRKALFSLPEVSGLLDKYGIVIER